jgi:MerR HTH family regulatory protein
MGIKPPIVRRPLLDARGAAAYTGFTQRQLRRWIDEKKLPIPIVRVSGRIYFRPEDLDRLVRIHEEPPPAAYALPQPIVRRSKVPVPVLRDGVVSPRRPREPRPIILPAS